MKSYFIILKSPALDEWEAYRAEWMKHRDAVLKFMNKVGGVEVRTNHFGAPIAVRFDHGVELPEGFRKTEWGSSRAHLINRKGEVLFTEEIEEIRSMFPNFPAHIPKHGFFDMECVWNDEKAPIYLLAQHEPAEFMRGSNDYQEITKEEWEFRNALDVFTASDRPDRVIDVLNEIVLGAA